MYGNGRKRFCGDCKLNVYNLSDMTRQDAENLLLTSEGRLCVRFFRRADGTVLTKNCPVGWQAVKRRVSRVATAVFSIVAGFFGGFISIKGVDYAISAVQPLNFDYNLNKSVPQIGEIDVPMEIEGQVDLSEFHRLKATKYEVLGRVQTFQRMEEKKVVAWIP